MVALDDGLFKQWQLWRSLPLELQAMIRARARWQQALRTLNLFKTCCIASGTRTFNTFFSHLQMQRPTEAVRARVCAACRAGLHGESESARPLVP